MLYVEQFIAKKNFIVPFCVEGSNVSVLQSHYQRIVQLRAKSNLSKTNVDFLDVETANSKGFSNSAEVEELKKLLDQEKMKKIQAVNKLAEIVQKKDGSKAAKGSKVNSADVKKKEKENRKLQAELKLVEFFIYYCYRYQKAIGIEDFIVLMFSLKV